MDRKTWMEQLDRALSQEGMTREEKRAVLNYYDEMYQDKRDDGAREEDILKEFGFPEDVAQNVREEGGKRKEKETSNYRYSPDYRSPEPYNQDPPPYRQDQPSQNTPYVGGYSNGNPNTGGYQGVQQPQPMPNRPYGQEKEPKKRGGGCVLLLMSPVTLIAGFFGLILMIVLYSLAVGLCVGGIGSVIGGVAALFSVPGEALIALGTGVLLFGVGGLLFIGATAFAKGWGRYMKWGLTGKGEKQ